MAHHKVDKFAIIGTILIVFVQYWKKVCLG